MNERTIIEIAESYGLEVEPAAGLPGDDRSFRIYKGVKQVYTGNEMGVRRFFMRYELERPGLYFEGMFGYKE